MRVDRQSAVKSIDKVVIRTFQKPLNRWQRFVALCSESGPLGKQKTSKALDKHNCQITERWLNKILVNWDLTVHTLSKPFGWSQGCCQEVRSFRHQLTMLRRTFRPNIAKAIIKLNALLCSRPSINIPVTRKITVTPRTSGHGSLDGEFLPLNGNSKIRDQFERV